MAWGKVDLCGLDTSKLPVLTPQRMQELYPLVHSGDKAARDEFIQGNLRLVLSVIQRFSGRGENVDDLFQVGCIGLMKALDNFDVSQNVRFSTYAVPMVIGEIRRYLRDNNAIRVSRSMRDTAYKALRARDRLQTELSREPTVEEIAADMHIDRMDVVLALEAIQDPVSLFEPVCSDGSDALCIVDQVKDERVRDEDWVQDIAISDAMGHLNEREKKILRMRFFEEYSYEEIAAKLALPLGTVKTQIHRAREQMCRMISEGEKH